MDHLQLSGIRCYGYTGALAAEQILGQWFEVDLTLWFDLTLAGQSDRLEDTLDYGLVITTIRELVQTRKFALIERLATVIAETVLTFPQVQQVRVQLTKCQAPIPQFDGTVTVDLVRQKAVTNP